MALLAIFRGGRYLALALAASAVAFMGIAVFSQARLLAGIIPDGEIALAKKVEIIFAIPYGMLTDMTANSLMTLAITVLFGVSVAGIVYYFQLYRATAVSAMSAFSAGGVASGIIALGCAACGSLVFGFLASFFSASSLLIFIPYQSIVFGTLSIMMLGVSLYLLNKKLASV